MSTVTRPDGGGRALLVDGTGVVVRRLGPPDRDTVADLHRAMPLDDRYLRFFTVSRPDADRIADSILGESAVAYGAYRGERLLGVAHYIRSSDEEDPEVAIAVAHGAQHRGVASLLLEHLLAQAAAEGVTRLRADALARNHEVLRVLDDSGIPVLRRADGDVVDIVLDVRATAGEPYVHAVLERAATADVASLRPVLEPRSVAVIGADCDPRSVGRRVLRAIVAGGFTGPVFAVPPSAAAAVGGIPCHQRIEDLPTAVDLAVVCVPQAALPEVVERCGRSGIPAVLAIGTNHGAADCEELTAAIAHHGVRLVGPTGFGLLNTDPRVRLHATTRDAATAGRVGLAVASDAVALALVAELDRIGLGTSTAVTTGGGPDIDVDDMLLWWAADARTRAAVLQERQPPRPREYVLLARRLARRIPVLALLPHAAPDAPPATVVDEVRDELLTGAGVVAVDDIGEVPGLLAVLCDQPAPPGRRVAVLSAVAGGGDLAADACRRHGLQVVPLRTSTRAALRELLRARARVGNPVEVTGTAAAHVLGHAVDALLADPDVDAVEVLTAPGATDEWTASTAPRKPVVEVRLGQPERVGVRSRGCPVPAFDGPAAAARALAVAASRAEWLRRPEQAEPTPAGVDAARTRELVTRHCGTDPGGGWVPFEVAADLVRAAGVRVLVDEAGPGFAVSVTVDAEWGAVLTAGSVPGKEAGHCLLPATAPDLDDVAERACRARATPVVRDGVRDVLARLAWLAAVLPELTAVEIDPLVVTADGAAAHGVRVRLTPAAAVRPWSRDLPM